MLGGGIYVFFRPDAYISVCIRTVLKVPTYIGVNEGGEQGLILKFVCNYVCDMLWAYALTLTVYLVQEKRRYILIEMLIQCIVFEIFFEMLQKMGTVSGTFDIWDIILESTASIMAAVLIYRKEYSDECE